MANGILFIVNPKSGSGWTQSHWENKLLPKILHIFPDANWVLSGGTGHCSLLAHFAKKNMFHTVVAVGGDGTVNEVVNGLFDNPLIDLESFEPHIFGKPLAFEKNHMQKKPVLAILPTGTGCDYIKSIGVKNNVSHALQLIKNQKTIYCNVGKIQDLQSPCKRFFINEASVGLSAQVAQNVNKKSKNWFKNFVYWREAVRAILQKDVFPIRVSLDNEHEFETEARMLCICIGSYFGGGLKLFSDAKINDDFFHVLQFKNIQNSKIPALAINFLNGNFTHKDPLVSEYQCKKISIKSAKQNVPLECDGENIFSTPIEIELMPKSLEIIVG